MILISDFELKLRTIANVLNYWNRVIYDGSYLITLQYTSHPRN